jgi:hypothetical protein
MYTRRHDLPAREEHRAPRPQAPKLPPHQRQGAGKKKAEKVKKK